ncbi:PilN domain-containing protein [Oceanospirillum sediminis]|uniref:Pilus assembly protein PilN n=1 Tax=Oceanospirillum sediminis TaxID=2760088 RepID=A0A839IU31_9GAMM|nr:hypothetical protein [Oceanospirillum sediminis]MBB1487937.1 hypothetical protein [Oceanospirillum sediminis]
MTPRINLLPWREYKRKQDQRRFLLYILLSSGSAALLIMLWHLYLSYQSNHLLYEQEYIQQITQRINQSIEKINQLQQKKQQILARTQQIAQLHQQRAPVLKQLNLLAKAHTQGVQLLSAESRNHQLQLTGKTRDNIQLSTYMKRLGQLSPEQPPPVLLSIRQVLPEQTGQQVHASLYFHLKQEQLHPTAGPSDNTPTSSKASSKENTQ